MWRGSNIDNLFPYEAITPFGHGAQTFLAGPSISHRRPDA